VDSEEEVEDEKEAPSSVEMETDEKKGDSTLTADIVAYLESHVIFSPGFPFFLLVLHFSLSLLLFFLSVLDDVVSETLPTFNPNVQLKKKSRKRNCFILFFCFCFLIVFRISFQNMKMLPADFLPLSNTPS
jgi:hypothetical protein